MDGSFDPTAGYALSASKDDVSETSRSPRARSMSRPYALIGKRALDIFIVLFSAWLTLPLIAICAALAARDGHSPFFGHKRVGLNGKEFKCWKIRTMVPHAEAKLAEYLDANPAAKAEWKATRKLKNDPRINRFGQFMRKTSLDELPQIFNVLMGQMSIVGPRPVVKDELDLYGTGRTAYLSLRPGITGLWQVSGRNNISYEERVKFDIDYFSNLNLLQDIKIILQTVRVVLVRTGY
jgi:exopolysaccharide production protein ExoY